MPTLDFPLPYALEVLSLEDEGRGLCSHTDPLSESEEKIEEGEDQETEDERAAFCAETRHCMAMKLRKIRDIYS